MREYLLVLVGLIVGSVGSIVLAGVTWATVDVAAVLGTDQVRVAGTDLVPVAEAVGWLGLAAVLAIHAGRGVGRSVVGVLLTVAGLVVAGWAGWRTANLDTAGVTAAAAESAVDEDAILTLSGTTPAAPIGTAVAGILVAAAGLLAVVRGSRWPGMGRKYERPDRTGTAGTTATRGASEPPAAQDSWDALDRGDDPTTWLRGHERTGQNESDATNEPGRRTRP